MVNQLLDLLDLEVIDRDVYRGANPPGDGRRIFGGQVAAQALRATTLTVPAGNDVNSLHAYFLRPGRPGVPIAFLVDRIRDGRSFTTRRVVARQDGEAIFNLDASFHKGETGARARGLVRGGFFTRDGVLAVSISQEALLRPVDERRSR